MPTEDREIISSTNWLSKENTDNGKESAISAYGSILMRWEGFSTGRKIRDA
jgi:hypothetical protein